MPTLDELYNQTVNEQRDYLTKLQDAFNRHCDEITTEAQHKLKEIPETNIEARQAVFQEQRKKLDEALAQLKTEVDTSTGRIRRKLEEIHRQREELKLKELEQIMTKF